MLERRQRNVPFNHEERRRRREQLHAHDEDSFVSDVVTGLIVEELVSNFTSADALDTFTMDTSLSSDFGGFDGGSSGGGGASSDF